MADETFTRCPSCREVLDPTNPDATYAVELRRIDSFGSTEWVEGMGGYFHPGCSPGALGWREKPRPA